MVVNFHISKEETIQMKLAGGSGNYNDIWLEGSNNEWNSPEPEWLKNNIRTKFVFWTHIESRQ
jgi:hypothetical protein